MAKTQVGVIYGGRSVEHDISLLSARNILKNIDVTRYEVYLLAIDKKGKWFLCSDIDKPINNGKPLFVALDANDPYFYTDNDQLRLDVIFPILHGTDGEDGSIQGLLQSLNIAFVGSGVLGSAASMDKLITKRVLKSAGLPVTPFVAIQHDDKDETKYNNLVDELGSTLIVKPANLGSSVGVTKVSSKKEFESAVALAFKYDETILVEKYIDGREVECAIFGNDKPIASVAGEVRIADKYELYSFTAKYEDPDAAEIIIPAAIPDSVHERVKSLSLEAYKLLNCLDLARVDLFITNDETVYINEVNTLPGFTNISMYPLLMQNEEMAYQELITGLIEMAEKRHLESRRITTDYESQL